MQLQLLQDGGHRHFEFPIRVFLGSRLPSYGQCLSADKFGANWSRSGGDTPVCAFLRERPSAILQLFSMQLCFTYEVPIFSASDRNNYCDFSALLIWLKMPIPRLFVPFWSSLWSTTVELVVGWSSQRVRSHFSGVLPPCHFSWKLIKKFATATVRIDRRTWKRFHSTYLSRAML